MINPSMIWKNCMASSHNLKMAGRSFGRKKNYGLTVTMSSEINIYGMIYVTYKYVNIP